MAQHRVILLHAAAAPKPAEGAACNGCGVCCAAQPCPLGMLLSWRRQGACKALDWDDTQQRYRCGAVQAPQRWLPWLPAALSRRLVLRWIAAAAGCDSDLQTAVAPDELSGSRPLAGAAHGQRRAGPALH